MKDNEIIKALECCFVNRSCKDCPLDENNEDASCTRIVKNEAAKLCLRQKAEIERYKGVIKLLENDMLTAKAEAVKEFEKLVTRRLNCNTPRGAYLLNIMSEVKKETTESVNYGSSKTEGNG